VLLLLRETAPGRGETHRRRRVVLTFSEWPINFVYPPACIINARLLPRENPWGPPCPAVPTEVESPPLPPCLSKSQQSPSSLKLISNNRTLLITRPRRAHDSGRVMCSIYLRAHAHIPVVKYILLYIHSIYIYIYIYIGECASVETKGFKNCIRFYIHI